MSVDRHALIEWYRRNRERTRLLFDLIDSEAYYSRPIALRHPIVFYEGHLPAFSFNTLVKRGLGGASIDARLEQLFARGIDPDGPADATAAARVSEWPSRAEVQAFADEADRRVLDALVRAEIEQPGHLLLDRAEAAFTILEHEAMHQETLLYMWHRLPFDRKTRPAGYAPAAAGATPRQEWMTVPAGRATLGVDREETPFGWDNERPAYHLDVPAFEIERHNVTNEAYLGFIDEGGYENPRWWRPEDWDWVTSDAVRHPAFWERHDGAWYWRGMFDLLPLPASWPVYLSCAEASAYARWRGLRLPHESEYLRAASGDPAPGAFDLSSWDPAPAGSHPAGRSAWGVEDLVGNGWEWTDTPFAPFPGFRPSPSYPEYSADFFDNDHFVLKGASPATARELVRPTFRNWFRPRYPYVYAAFRCVKADPA